MFNPQKNNGISSQNHYALRSLMDSIEFPVIKVKMAT